MSDDGVKLCEGGPYDGQSKLFLMEREGVFILGIPGKREPKILGYYVPSKDGSKYIWEPEER